MAIEDSILQGDHVRLEPLGRHHVAGLAAAAAADSSLYQWTVVPQGEKAVAEYVDTALSAKGSGRVLPFATVRVADGAVIGSTRFFDVEKLPWPTGHPMAARSEPDVCEIGYTWLTAAAIRTAANTEAKLLMLTHAFEEWRVLRVCLHTDERNNRSRAAMERMGARFEGILRVYRMAADQTARNSARYSIVAAEWPDVKQRLNGFLR
jgi:RimJ/RimL family protein N-acetyltransferase